MGRDILLALDRPLLEIALYEELPRRGFLKRATSFPEPL